MTNTDLQQMIEDCVREIGGLRQQIGDLSPKAQAYTSIQQILDLLPKNRLGVAPDILWKLSKELEKIKAERGS